MGRIKAGSSVVFCGDRLRVLTVSNRSNNDNEILV